MAKQSELSHYPKPALVVMRDAARKLKQTKAQRARVAILSAEIQARRA